MKEMEKKIKGFLGMATGTMVLMILLGLLFVCAPKFILSVLQWGITTILLITGCAMIATDMKTGRFFSIFSTSLMGIFFILMGIIVATHRETLNIVTIAFGVYMVLNSFMSLSVASNIRGTSAYLWALLTNIIGLVCGIIMIVHPGGSNEAIISVAGVVLIVYGISGLIDTLIIRSRINEVEKNFKAAKKSAKVLLEDAEEAEVVEKKSTKKSSKK